MTTKQFYKMPADLLQTDCVQKMLQENGGMALFGLSMLMWLIIQGTREKKVSERILKNYFWGFSSNGQRRKVYESGLFSYDEASDSYSVNPIILHAGDHAGNHADDHATDHAGDHAPKHYSEDLDIEVEEKAHPHPHEEIHKFNNSLILDSNKQILDLIRDLKNTQPDRGELWEGVLLCCPDQELRKMMVEHWPETVDYLTKHLESRSTEVTDQTSLCNILRELVQPSSLVFSSLKLFLTQEVKSEAEKAFDRWLSNLNNICLMQEPLTFKQFNELVQICHDPVKVRKTAERLNNYPSTPTRYVSAYKTMMDWLENPR